MKHLVHPGTQTHRGLEHMPVCTVRCMSQRLLPAAWLASAALIHEANSRWLTPVGEQKQRWAIGMPGPYEQKHVCMQNTSGNRTVSNWLGKTVRIWVLVPKDPCVKGLAPKVVLLGGGKPLGGRAWWEVLRSSGVCVFLKGSSHERAVIRTWVWVQPLSASWLAMRFFLHSFSSIHSPCDVDQTLQHAIWTCLFFIYSKGRER